MALQWWSPLRASRDVTRVLLAGREGVEKMRTAPSMTRGLMTSGTAASSSPSLRRGGTALVPPTLAGEKDGQEDDVADLAFQDADQTIACLHGGASTCSSRRVLKLLRREVCVVTPALEASQPLKWSDVPITFSRADHPENIKGVGRLPIVVTPTIRNVRVGRVLIDGGSGLN